MRRTAGLGLILVAALMIGGCGEREPEAPATPAPAETPAEAAPADTVQADTAESASPDEAEPQAQVNESQPTGEKPTVLGAIGRAVAGALGAPDEKEERSEAPAYRPGP